MNAIPKHESPLKDDRFSDADFKAIASIAYKEFGLNLSESKKPLVYSRLTKRLRTLGVSDFKNYLIFLDGPNGEPERMELLSALTTNVTNFFRENHHFELLKNELLLPLTEAAKSGSRVRIWSAGCSSGQEPYSIAFTLLNACPDAANLDVKILATDIDPKILEAAASGNYPKEELADIPKKFQDKYLTASSLGEKYFQIGPEARRLISFGRLNLIDNWPLKGPFDLIFCRNVAIYFDKVTQAKVWSSFSKVLNPGGHLFIGHSERLSGAAQKDLKPVGVTAYIKQPATNN
jgi:chemotaxis protein methyltransferase CheR